MAWCRWDRGRRCDPGLSRPHRYASLFHRFALSTVFWFFPFLQFYLEIKKRLADIQWFHWDTCSTSQLLWMGERNRFFRNIILTKVTRRRRVFNSVLYSLYSYSCGTGKVRHQTGIMGIPFHQTPWQGHKPCIIRRHWMPKSSYATTKSSPR